MRKQMKNILLAGACAAMVCSAVCGVSAWQAPVAQADEATPVLEIGRKNLLLEDNIQIMFQVKTDNAIVSDSDVKLLVWTQPQEAYTYGTQNTVIGYNANKTFEEEPYYVYTELAIKQMTDDVYVCAYANVDGTEYYSAPAKYSILEYACNKLDKTEAEPTQDEDLKVLLGKMLDFGAAMQTLKEYKDDRLANADYVYVRLAEGDTFADGFNYGLFQEDEKVAVYGDLSHAMYEELLVTEDGVEKLVVPAEKLVIEDKEEPEVPEEPEITYTEVAKNYVIADYAAGTQYADNEEHVLDEYVTITTTDCHFTSELRIYASGENDGQVIISATNLISQISMNIGDNADILNIYGSEDGIAWTEDPIAQVTSKSSYSDVTVSFDSKAYQYLKLDVAGTEQLRIKEFTLTLLSTNDKPVVADPTQAEKNLVKAEAERDSFTLAALEVVAAGSVELPTVGSNGVVISWELVSQLANVSLKDNVLTTSANPASDTTITLKATFTCGEGEDAASVSKEGYTVAWKHKDEAVVVEETKVSVKIQDYASANGWTNGKQYSSVKLDNNITVSASGGSNTGKYYTSGYEWRTYQTESAKITITAANGKTIKSVKITYNISNTGTLKNGTTNVSSGTMVQVNNGTITFSVGNTGSATNGQVKITAIEVVYV